MTPLLNVAFRQAIDQATQLSNQSECLINSPMPEQLVSAELIREMNCTPEGMLLFPIRDPMSVATYFQAHHSLVFSREKNSESTYDWVTIWPDNGGFALWIMAGENIDMTGSVVTPNQH